MDAETILKRQIFLIECLINDNDHKEEKIEFLQKVVEHLIDNQCWQCKPLFRCILSINIADHQKYFSWCLAVIKKIVSQKEQTDSPKEVRKNNSIIDECNIENNLNKNVVRDLRESVKRGLAIFILKGSNDESEMRSVIKIFNFDISDSNFKNEMLQEYPEIKPIVLRFS